MKRVKLSGKGKTTALLLSLFMVASISVSACCPAEEADLRITAVRFIPDPVPLGQDFEIQVDIINSGSVATGSFHVEWTSPGGLGVGWDVDQGLGAGQSDTLVDIEVPCDAQDVGMSTAVIDDNTKVEESNEFNNEFLERFDCE